MAEEVAKNVKLLSLKWYLEKMAKPPLFVLRMALGSLELFVEITFASLVCEVIGLGCSVSAAARCGCYWCFVAVFLFQFSGVVVSVVAGSAQRVCKQAHGPWHSASKLMGPKFNF